MTDDELRVLVDARLSKVTHAYGWARVTNTAEELMTAMLWALQRQCQDIEHVNAMLALSDDDVMELVVLAEKHYKMHIGAGPVSVWIDTNVNKLLTQVPGVTMYAAWRVIQNFMAECLAKGVDPLSFTMEFTTDNAVADAFYEREVAKAKGEGIH